MKTYLVGGAVRDKLLGLPVTEHDWVVVGSTPEEMLALGYRPVGKDFPVFLHPESGDEYALARTERKTGHGYHGFSFHAAPDVTLEEDLVRRDLTINAIAMDESGELIDPYGGREDLQLGKLRHVSPAFREDPLRVLRVARFLARLEHFGFDISKDTLRLMSEMVAEGEVDHLVPERVWQETRKALEEQRPHRYFETLRKCGALKVLFPEIDALYGVPQPRLHHPEVDTGVHTMMVVEQAAHLSMDPKVRFAALVHDLGKGATPPESWPRHHGHEELGVNLVDQLCDRLKAPNDYRELARLVARYHGHFRRITDELSAKSTVKTLMALDAFRRPERFREFLLASEADMRGRTGKENEFIPHGRNFIRCLEAAQGVDVSAVIADGFEGAAVGDELYARRVSAVQAVLQEIRCR